MLLLVSLLLVSVSSASAEPAWRITSVHGPQNMPPGGSGQYVIQVYNAGDTDLNTLGEMQVNDTLPAGVTATGFLGEGWSCGGLNVAGGLVSCTQSTPVPRAAGDSVLRGVAPRLKITVSVDASNSGALDNAATVTGGEAPDASTTDPTTFDVTPAGFGFVPDSFVADTFDAKFPGGTPVRQADAHPFEARFGFDMNLKLSEDPDDEVYGDLLYTEPEGSVRTVQTRLPAGLIGNPQAMPKCSAIALSDPGPGNTGRCPSNTQVGSVDLVLSDGKQIFPDNGMTQDLPVFNVEPPPGAVAAFAFSFVGNPVWIIASVDPTDYSVVATIDYANEIFPPRSTMLTLWGVPGDPAHDALRLNPHSPGTETALGAPSNAPIRPFLTLPSECGVDGVTSMSIDSWQSPGDFVTAVSPASRMTGCEDPRLRFKAGITAQPESSKANTPTALDLELTVPQKDDTVTSAEELYSQSGKDQALATPPLRDATVVLPEGVRVSPSSADGLASCSTAQIKLHTNDEPSCPDASKIGTVSVETPLLGEPLTGSVYLAAQTDNPFGSLLALYLVVKGPGVIVKLPGHVTADPVTGRLTTTFDDNPQIPFSHLHVHLNGGPRAALVTPSACGTDTTTAQLSSWNDSLPAVQSEDSFTISGDGHGGACAPRSFAPGFTAGTRNPAAGGFAPFALRLTRSDGDSELGSLASLHLPRGLLADIGSVPTRCTDAQAASASCPAASHIGEVTVGAGAGANPVYVGGDVYLTGPYRGAPFGLAIVVHAAAGPFDLGYVTVRAAVQVNSDGTVTTKSDPFPTILQGIPLQLKDIRVSLDRPHFMVNPTNCNPLRVDGTVGSTTGQSAVVSSRFQVGECRSLPFHPSFRASTAAKVSRTNGASLRVMVKSGAGQANIRSVKVKLPKQLASRLTTLQQACTEAVFAANPASCPAGSRVGVARAITPILASPLAGPAYFVSHGGAKFPELVVVLEGEGVTIDLAGETFIDSKGITSSTFRSVPDAPISTFELSLPTGPHSALGSKANLCKSKLAMPTLITGQNGAVVKQSTKIAVNGCAKHKTHNGRGGGR